MKKLYKLFFATLLTVPFIGNTSATIITYESLPTGVSDNMSHHTAGGPVLADDFNPDISGDVFQVDWWGSVATSDSWELTFHSDAGGQPDTTYPSGVISQHIANTSAVDMGNGMYFYTAAWNPMDLFLSAGVDYWFSVANFDTGWTWANAFSPNTGLEAYDAVVSTGIGPNGGPHYGPWNGTMDITGAPTPEDFAFRIHVVPEPETLAILALGLLALSVRKNPAKRKSVKS